MKKLLSLVLGLFVIALASPATWAAEGQAQKKDYEAFSLGELYVTGDKLPTSWEATQTTEITAEQIEATHSQTVAEALTYVPGVTVTTGRKNQPTVYIHGLNQNKAIVLIDGVPYYETNYGSLNLGSIPASNIAKIEVQKGVSSVLYGPNAIAGVINIVTKKAGTKPSLGLAMEVGDYEARRFTAWNGMQVGKYNYWVSYDHQESKGWYLSKDFVSHPTRIRYTPPPNVTTVLEDGNVRNNADMKMDGVWAKVGVEPTKGSEYYVNFHYITTERGAPASILDDSNRVFTARPAFSQLSRMPRDDNWGMDLSGQQQIGGRFTVKGKLFYHEHVDDYDSFRNPDYSGFLSTSRYQDNMLGASLMSDIKLAKTDTLKFSAHYRRDQHEERADAYLPLQEADSYTGSLGVENEYNPTKNLSLVAGVSYDWFDVAKSNQNVTVTTATATTAVGDFVSQKTLTTPDSNKVNPMVGATYTFDDGTRVYASWAQKIRFPTLSALYSSSSGNPDLQPEKSTNYVVGISRAITQYARGEASFFVYDVKDLISRDAPGPTSPYINYGSVFIYGTEVVGEVYPTGDLTLRAAYTYNKAANKSEGRVNDDVTFIPQHKIDLSIAYMVPVVKAKIDFNGLYVSQMYGQLPTGSSPALAILTTSDYFIMGLRISKTLFKNFEAYFGAKNLLDKDYEQEVGFPAPGRNLYAGVKFEY
ncbi:MAG: TonB-dependent receptor [Deltaproteobacteria bacterium]|nr:TonB-dependent receptor [Deltaproteobacteria bacterium]